MLFLEVEKHEDLKFWKPEKYPKSCIVWQTFAILFGASGALLAVLNLIAGCVAVSSSCRIDSGFLAAKQIAGGN